MKVKEWLGLYLNEVEQKRFKDNLRKIGRSKYLEEEKSNFHYTLTGGFSFDNSDEGIRYWYNILERTESKKISHQLFLI